MRLERPGGVLEVVEIEPWLDQLLQVLDYAHGQIGMIHRDLKPANILLTNAGQIKVSDFGIACCIAETMTRVSTFGTSGTLAYMSPQQYDGDPPTAADDWYSLGATLYDLLTGKPPFYRGGIADQIRTRQAESLRTRRQQLKVPAGTISREWEAFIAACLSKRPEDRPQNGAAVRRLLTPYNKTGKSTGTVGRSIKQGRTCWTIGLGGLAALAAIGVAWLAWTARSDETVAESAAFAEASSVAVGDAVHDGVLLELAGENRFRDVGPLKVPIRSEGVQFVEDEGRNSVSFSGSSWLETGRHSEFAASGDSAVDVTMELWPARDETAGTQTLAVLGRAHVGEFYWLLSRSGRNLFCHVGLTQENRRIEVLVTDALVEEAWQMVQANYDHGVLSLAVNGVVLGQSRGELSIESEGTPGYWVFGADASHQTGFRGRVRHIRVTNSGMKLPVDGGSGKSMVGGDTDPQLAGYPFAVTAGSVSETEDLPAIVEMEFGPQVKLADWQDFKPWLEAQRDPGAALDALGIGFQANAFVTNDGRRLAEGDRHYFVTRFNGTVPEYYTTYDTAAGAMLALGSWRGVNLKILVAADAGAVLLPSEEQVDPQPENMPEFWQWQGGSSDQLRSVDGLVQVMAGPDTIRLKRSLAGAVNRGSLALSARIRMGSSQWGSEVALVFTYADGRTVRLVNEVADSMRNVQRIRLEDGTGRLIAHEHPQELGDQELVLLITKDRVRGVVRRVSDGGELFAENSTPADDAGDLVRASIEIKHQSGPSMALHWVRLRAESEFTP